MGRTIGVTGRLHQGLNFTWIIWYSTWAVSKSCCIRSNPDFIPLLNILLSHPRLLPLHYRVESQDEPLRICCLTARVYIFHNLPLSWDTLVNKQIMGYANCMYLVRKEKRAFSPLHEYQLASLWLWPCPCLGDLWNLLLRQEETSLGLGKYRSWSRFPTVYRTWNTGNSEKSEERTEEYF